MSFCHSMVKRRVPSAVRRIERAFVLEEEFDQRY